LNTAPLVQGSRFDLLGVTKNISLALIGVLMLILVVDSLVVFRKKAVRLSGHNFAHLLFLMAVLALLNLVGRTGLTL
jgi:hypothetical protein